MFYNAFGCRLGVVRLIQFQKLGIYFGFYRHNNGISVTAYGYAQAVEGINAGGPAGVLLQAKIPQAGKAMSIVSDAAWKVSDSEVAGWQGTDFDDSAWQAAVSLGAPPSGPWGDVAGPGF